MMTQNRRPPRAPLTPRELQVLKYISAGFETSEIARELGLVPRGVIEHVRNLMRKLKARNRAHAVSLAYRRGVLQPARRLPKISLARLNDNFQNEEDGGHPPSSNAA
jgi:DNA-binding CsgD family transcriptional regulator